MNVVLLVDKYYPVPQANENCALAILEAMDDCHVDVICKVNSEEAYQSVMRQNGGIPPVLVPVSPSLMDSGVFRKLKYVWTKIWKIFFGRLYSHQATRAYISSFEQIFSKKKVDAVVAVQSPLETVEAVCQLKRKYPELKTIIYDVDTASNCSMGILERRFANFYLNKVYRWEKRVFTSADLIIHLAQHRNHFSQKQYARFLNKTLFQEVPLLKCDIVPKKRGENQPISFLYSGSFYRKFRSPHLITDLMDYVCENEACMTSYYVNPEYYPTLSEKYADSKNVRVSPFVSEQQLKEVLRNTDFLLSLGNKDSEMFPSKVVQYVAARKPIIHVYQSANDPVITFLENYPDKLLIDSNGDFDGNCRKILEFINRERPAISVEDIQKQYEVYSGKYNADQIICFLKTQENKS